MRITQRLMKIFRLWKKSRPPKVSTQNTPGGVIRGLLVSYQMRAGPSTEYSKPKRATTSAGFLS